MDQLVLIEGITEKANLIPTDYFQNSGLGSKTYAGTLEYSYSKAEHRQNITKIIRVLKI